jgi:hypothetical protein
MAVLSMGCQTLTTVHAQCLLQQATCAHQYATMGTPELGHPVGLHWCVVTLVTLTLVQILAPSAARSIFAVATTLTELLVLTTLRAPPPQLAVHVLQCVVSAILHSVHQTDSF